MVCLCSAGVLDFISTALISSYIIHPGLIFHHLLCVSGCAAILKHKQCLQISIFFCCWCLNQILVKYSWIFPVGSQLKIHEDFFRNECSLNVDWKHSPAWKITSALVVSAPSCDLMMLESFMMSEQLCISCCSNCMFNKFMACSYDFWLALCRLVYIKYEMFAQLSVSPYNTD